MSVGDRVKRGQGVDQEQILQRSWRKEGIRQGCRRVGVAVLGIVGRGEFLLVVVIAEVLELVQMSNMCQLWKESIWRERKRESSLVAKLAGRKEVSRLQDAQARRDGHSVKVLDLDVIDHLALVVDGHFEKVAVFRLQEEEECALSISFSSISCMATWLPRSSVPYRMHTRPM